MENMITYKTLSQIENFDDLEDCNPIHIAKFIGVNFNSGNEYNIVETLKDILIKIQIYKKDDYLSFSNSLGNVWYYTEDLYLSLNICYKNTQICFRYFNLYYEIIGNYCYYSHKCRCCEQCDGLFEFLGDISNFSLIDNELYKMSINNCINKLDYNMIGIYRKNDNMFYTNVTYKDNSTYKGLWKDGWPHKYGIMSFRMKDYKEINNINTMKFYGMWKNGILDDTKKEYHIHDKFFPIIFSKDPALVLIYS